MKKGTVHPGSLFPGRSKHQNTKNNTHEFTYGDAVHYRGCVFCDKY